MGFQSKTYSLSDEVVAWIEELRADYGSPNKGLLAIMALNEDMERGVSRATRERLNTAGAVESPTNPLIGISGLLEHHPLRDEYLSAVTKDNRPKNAHCKHCGSRFAGSRFATICHDCKSSGHTLTPAECPVCGDQGTGGL